MRLRFVAGALALALFGSPPAFACFDVDSPPSAAIHFVNPTTVELTVTGLVVKAAGVNPGDYCAAGLGHTGTLISSVTAPDVVDADDEFPTPDPAFGFGSNATTTGDMVTLVPTTASWAGFHSAIAVASAGGNPGDLRFTVAVPSGTTYTDIETELAGDGFLITDDANAAGNLAGTNQQVEAFSAVTELTDCYNDIVESPQEVCDAASSMGCLPGEICADCSQCVPANYANKCKSSTLNQIGKTDKARLKCYAAAAKIGQPVDVNCLNRYQFLITTYWLKVGQSDPTKCPLFGTYPSDTAIDALVDGLSNDLVTALPLGGTSGAWKCATNKFKAASLRAVNTLKCYAKAVQHNTAVSALCLSKIDQKYNQAFARAETPGLCDAGNVGNAASVATLIDAFVTDGVNGVVDLIPPP